MCKCHFATEVTGPGFLAGGVPSMFAHRECFAPLSKTSKYQTCSSKSHRFFFVILKDSSRWPRKLLLETELYESIYIINLVQKYYSNLILKHFNMINTMEKCVHFFTINFSCKSNHIQNCVSQI